MKQTTFENAQVGDKVYSIVSGWGTIEDVDFKTSPIFPIGVRFPNGEYRAHDINGICWRRTIRTLFWDEVKIVPPSRPKRKVKKVGIVYFTLENGNKIPITMPGESNLNIYSEVPIDKPMTMTLEWEE